MFGVRNNDRPSLGRRRFLELGSLSGLGLMLPELFRAKSLAHESPNTTFGRAERCILVYLCGGPSQIDTWDPKPDAPAEVRGELTPIATRTPGVQFSELSPRLAAQSDKFTLVRSVTHTDTEHTTSFATMLTGTYHPRPGVVQSQASPADHPHLGSILSKQRGWRDGMPPFVALPTLFQPPNNGIWPGQGGGFLGPSYDPMVVQGEKESCTFQLPAIELADTVSQHRFGRRRELLNQLNSTQNATTPSPTTNTHGKFYEQAFSILESGRLSTACDLEQESASTRELYGQHLFGQGLLLARRCAEAGVGLSTVYWVDPQPPGEGGGEFDSHGRIYHHMRNRLMPPVDQALSALFFDLHQRGLLDTTLVLVMSEFGRSPTINSAAGRDHWPWAQSVLLAGAGISGGRTFGATDRYAAYPSDDPIEPPDLAQTVLHLLGVGADIELRDLQGRPIAACRGNVLHPLIA